MNSIIKEILTNGKNYCEEELTCEEYVSQYEKYSKAYEDLIKSLSEEDKKLLIEIDGCLTQIDKTVGKEKFIQGFKAGLQFATEIFKY